MVEFGRDELVLSPQRARLNKPKAGLLEEIILTCIYGIRYPKGRFGN
jgi:hypothetical protein